MIRFMGVLVGSALAVAALVVFIGIPVEGHLHGVDIEQAAQRRHRAIFVIDQL